MTLTLYFAPGASSMAPHIALHEIGSAFEPRPLSLARKENRAPAYLALNPEGNVPTLLIDGRPLTEVAAILFYLARRFPAAGLMPEGDEGEAQAISWMSFTASTVHWGLRGGGERARNIFTLADRKLGARDWVLGRYSVADIHLFRLFWRFRPLLDAPPGAFPSLEAHYERMMARPAVRRTCEIEAAIGYEIPRGPASARP